MDIYCAVCDFFARHLVEIYFVYGLAFFVTGLAVWLEASRASALPQARALPFLAGFGLIHGSHEWVEMFQLMAPDPPTPLFQVLRLLALAVSFALLVEFGLRSLEICKAAGVRMGFGTDIIGDQELHTQEFLLRAQVLPRHEIIASATRVGAQILRREGELGVIAAGAVSYTHLRAHETT